MIGQQFHQIIFQKTIRTAGRALASRSTRRTDLSLLGKSSLLCKVNQVGFALLLQPGVGHGGRYELSRVSAAITMT
jgi:hypothetical protein